VIISALFDASDARPKLVPNLYPTENDLEFGGCLRDDSLQIKHDSNYNQLVGWEVNEFDVQVNSGVLYILENLDHYDEYVDSEAKKDVEYYFWWRETIGISQTCEANIETVISNMYTKLNILEFSKSYYTYYSLLLIMYLTGLLFPILSTCAQNKPWLSIWYIKVATFITFGILAVLHIYVTLKFY
jgi:hypothetical protein